jgi:hypothetical protein
LNIYKATHKLAILLSSPRAAAYQIQARSATAVPLLCGHPAKPIARRPSTGQAQMQFQ